MATLDAELRQLLRDAISDARRARLEDEDSPPDRPAAKRYANLHVGQPLTPAQAEVCGLSESGLTTREIATARACTVPVVRQLLREARCKGWDGCTRPVSSFSVADRRVAASPAELSGPQQRKAKEPRARRPALARDEPTIPRDRLLSDLLATVRRGVRRLPDRRERARIPADAFLRMPADETWLPCPRCGDLCPPAATLCECGARLLQKIGREWSLG